MLWYVSVSICNKAGRVNDGRWWRLCHCSRRVNATADGIFWPNDRFFYYIRKDPTPVSVNFNTILVELKYIFMLTT